MTASKPNSSVGALSSTNSLTDPIPPETASLEKTALGFLDLPPESRLDIYGYLLLGPTAYSPQASDKSYSGQVRALPVRVWQIPEGIQPSVFWVSGDCSFYPAIFSTCRTIHEEATAVLYGKNIFWFRMHGYTHDESNRNCSISEQCKNIFKYNDKNWRLSDGPLLLRDSPFACFLNKIGPRNAASLKAIVLNARRYDIGIYQFHLMANLLERHLIGLKFISISVNGPGDGTLWPPLTRADEEKELKQLCRTLTNLVRVCRSLETFEYRGNGFNAVPDLEAKTEYLRELIQLLKERKEKKDSRLEKSQEKEEHRF